MGAQLTSPTVHIMRSLLSSSNLRASLVVMTSLIALPLHAQVLGVEQIDFNRARSDAALGTSFSAVNLPTSGSIISFSTYPNAGSEVARFSFNFLAPLDFTNNAIFAPFSPRNEFEATPEVRLGFLVHPTSLPVQFSASVDELSDRYSSFAFANYDQLYGTLRLDWTGTDEISVRDRWIPYLSYSPQQVFVPFFNSDAQRTQDFAVGVNKLWDFTANWTKLDTAAPDYPTWELGLQAGVQRRIVNVGNDSDAILVSPSVKWSSSNGNGWIECARDSCGQLATSLGVNLTQRWYGNNAGREWDVSPILTIAWVLPGKYFNHDAARYGTPEIDFQLAYYRQNVSEEGPYEGFVTQQWSLGPTVKVGWNF
jgi:hypothetical protein